VNVHGLADSSDAVAYQDCVRASLGCNTGIEPLHLLAYSFTTDIRIQEGKLTMHPMHKQLSTLILLLMLILEV
jgi:hypothetical protein